MDSFYSNKGSNFFEQASGAATTMFRWRIGVVSLLFVWLIFPHSGAAQTTSTGSDHPNSFNECDEFQGTNRCGVWAFTGTNGTYSSNGLYAGNLVLKKTNGNGVEIDRTDTAGGALGLTAVYLGTMSGANMSGTVTWKWPGHFPAAGAEGTWFATIIPYVDPCDAIDAAEKTREKGTGEDDIDVALFGLPGEMGMYLPNPGSQEENCYMKQAAKEGFAQADFYLGYYDQNLSEGRKLAKLAASLGSTQGMYLLDGMEDAGAGGAVNHSDAAALRARAHDELENYSRMCSSPRLVKLMLDVRNAAQNDGDFRVGHYLGTNVDEDNFRYDSAKAVEVDDNATFICDMFYHADERVDSSDPAGSGQEVNAEISGLPQQQDFYVRLQKDGTALVVLSYFGSMKQQGMLVSAWSLWTEVGPAPASGSHIFRDGFLVLIIGAACYLYVIRRRRGQQQD